MKANGIALGCSVSVYVVQFGLAVCSALTLTLEDWIVLSSFVVVSPINSILD